jgi:hypothetical protein
MAKINKGGYFTFPSLLQYFNPPEDSIGSFAMLCGYSATPDFLNLALDRFTGKTKNQRAHDGVVNMFLMLDKGNPQISMSSVPGLYHSGRQSNNTQPFRLLHAKVALLLFKNKDDNTKWTLRLLVSTGNWTSETLTDSLDLISSQSISYQDYKSSEENPRQSRADIIAAWDFFKWLNDYFPDTILKSVSTTRNSEEYSRFIGVLESLAKPRGVKPRFFDNRYSSLLRQLPELIDEGKTKVKRNYVALGSGFYQSPGDDKKIPSVLVNILDTLTRGGLLTKNPTKSIIVNPDACQAIANTSEVLQEEDWIIQPASDPLNKNRALHAKFIFSANMTGDSNNCSSPWLYLGSGNLTSAGFTHKISVESGNLEAGIMITPRRLFWELNKNVNQHECVEYLLPISLEYDAEESYQSVDELLAGDDFDTESDSDFVAPPVSWFEWIEKENGFCLMPEKETEIRYRLLSLDKNVCQRDDEGNWIWNDAQPTEVMVRWGDKYEAMVPVIDSFGRVAGKELAPLNLEEAWWLLEGYPNPTWDEDPEDEENLIDNEIFNSGVDTSSSSVVRRTQSYPLRQMMEFVEKIAMKNTLIAQQDWKVWCNRLEQSIIQTKDDNIYNVFRQMNINPISVLRKSAFRPAYAEDNSTLDGECYEEMLNNVELTLSLKNLKNL